MGQIFKASLCENFLSLSCLTYEKLEYPSFMKNMTSFSKLILPMFIYGSIVAPSGGSKSQLYISSVIS